MSLRKRVGAAEPASRPAGQGWRARLGIADSSTSDEQAPATPDPERDEARAKGREALENLRKPAKQRPPKPGSAEALQEEVRRSEERFKH